MMDDDLLLGMERAFRGDEYRDAVTRDWQPQLKRVLQYVRDNDPMIAELRCVISAMNIRLNEAIKEINHVHTPDCLAHGCQYETQGKPA